MLKKRLLVIVSAILLMVCFFLPVSIQAGATSSEPTVLEDLDRLSQETLTLTEQGQFEEAKGKLDQLATLFTQMGMKKSISIEALELASNTIVQGKRAFADVTPDKKELLWHTTQIRLLIDALTHPNQPIWKGYHMTYVEQVSKMIHLAQRKEHADLEKAIQDNMKLYTILKPAFSVNHNPSTMQMMDSLYTFLLGQSHEATVDWESVQQSLLQLRELTSNIFLGKDEFTFAWYISSNSPIAMISLMSFILISVLAYAAWKMYRGERYST